MGNPFDRLDGQGGKAARFRGLTEIPGKLINQGLQALAEGMRFRFGGLLTYEKPVVEFYSDIPIPASSMITLRAGTELPRNCVSLRFVDVIGNPIISINGGGARKLFNFDAASNCEIQILQIATAVGESCTVQANGTGD